MSVTLSSTTDSAEEVTRALESSGQTVEKIDVITNEPEKPVDDKKTETPAPAEKPASDKEAGKPGEGKTADVTETPEETEDAEEQVKGKKGGGAEKKIDRLTKEARQLAEEKAEATGRITELTRQVEELRELLPKPGDEKKPAEVEKTKEPEKTVEAKPKPVLADFETHEEWLDALTDWKAEQLDAKNRVEYQKVTAELAKLRGELAEKEQKSAEQSEGETRMAAFQERNADVIKAYPNWKEVSNSPDTVPISAAMQDLILDLDGGADVVMYLATHPDEAKKVLKLTDIAKDAKPREATRAIQLAGIEYARIHNLAVSERTAAAEAQALEDAGEVPKPADKPATDPKPKTQVSKTPAPIKPTKGAATSVADTPHDRAMNHKEYMEWYERTHPRKRA